MPAAAIVHVTHESTTPDQRDTVLALVAASDQIGPQIVVAGCATAPWLVEIAPEGPNSRRRVALADLATDGCLVHHWGPTRSFALMSLDLAGCGGVLVDIVLTQDPFQLSTTLAGVTVESHRSRSVAIGRGAAPDAVAVVRPWVDYSRIRPGQRDTSRSILGLGVDDPTVLLLPPVSRGNGSFETAWAALLVERVVRDLKFIVPDSRAEARRIERLAATIGRTGSAVFPDDRLDLPALLVAADVAVLAPGGDCPHRPIAWALAAGCPIVSAATPCACELLAHGVNARLCRESAPRTLAKRILETIEAADADREMIADGRRQAYSLFSRQRMIEQYRQVYENIVARRAASDGLIDPLVQSTSAAR